MEDVSRKCTDAEFVSWLRSMAPDTDLLQEGLAGVAWQFFSCAPLLASALPGCSGPQPLQYFSASVATDAGWRRVTRANVEEKNYAFQQAGGWIGQVIVRRPREASHLQKPDAVYDNAFAANNAPVDEVIASLHYVRGHQRVVAFFFFVFFCRLFSLAGR